ncbi:hypothetical protein GCM10009632_04660 [Mycolicibacterium alvei]|uniref:Uncharacterized protein n=1 Tax=Mycolicibacterium alvei TaxID=67081 RepID=A0A6N4V1P4_9MYCO|nr:hypothetical protein MALV_57140 [Mycolicibacterium alvei]
MRILDRARNVDIGTLWQGPHVEDALAQWKPLSLGGPRLAKVVFGRGLGARRYGGGPFAAIEVAQLVRIPRVGVPGWLVCGAVGAADGTPPYFR